MPRNSQGVVCSNDPVLTQGSDPGNGVSRVGYQGSACLDPGTTQGEAPSAFGPRHPGSSCAHATGMPFYTQGSKGKSGPYFSAPMDYHYGQGAIPSSETPEASPKRRTPNSSLRASKVHGPLRILTTNVGGSRVAILHALGLGADVVFVQEHKLSNGQLQGMANACRTQGWHGVWAPALSASEHHMGRSGGVAILVPHPPYYDPGD